MTPNVGTIDRILRAVVGALLLYLAFFSGLPLFAAPLIAYGAAAIAVILLATSVLRVCPLYSIFGFKTCHVA
ncbi:DUF2892 domain-containing protein [Pikeienuella piscinae]|uniref:DUF2892 domain-containing protein n=1 Tax=Pikeienuella piscinae TaxID=2748098 RepID=A0A7L5C417_9RHOB|nr:DUF2892 domain-containing protein [Pikeienuella piscinae]QIE56669.1 DUF2892 domain-containing protein [Pikeienuella piscinae]